MAQAVAAGPEGRALLVWASSGDVRVRERGASGGWGPVGAIAGPQVYPELVAGGPRDAVAIVATDQSEDAPGQPTLDASWLCFAARRARRASRRRRPSRRHRRSSRRASRPMRAVRWRLSCSLTKRERCS